MQAIPVCCVSQTIDIAGETVAENTIAIGCNSPVRRTSCWLANVIHIPVIPGLRRSLTD